MSHKKYILTDLIIDTMRLLSSICMRPFFNTMTNLDFFNVFCRYYFNFVLFSSIL